MLSLFDSVMSSFTSNNRTCEFCRFWHTKVETYNDYSQYRRMDAPTAPIERTVTTTECHYNPPYIIMHELTSWVSKHEAMARLKPMWPSTKPNDWCGKFESK